MNTSIAIKPLTIDTHDTFISVGIASYLQHYQHYWENNNSSGYIERNFTKKILQENSNDSNIACFIIYNHEVPIGLIKIKKDSAITSFTVKEAIELEKIYLLKEYSGKGIGKKALDFVVNYSRKLNKKVLWLDVMVTSPALQFYLNNGFKKTINKTLDFPNIKKEYQDMHIMVKKL